MYTAMTQLDGKQKTTHIRSQDWHHADVLCALKKAGWTLRQLSVHHGYAPGTLRHALVRPWPRAERLIADALGITPQTIWPSRYRRDGRPQSGRGERGIGRYKSKDSTRRYAGNVSKDRAA